ncbi:casein kinase [Stylonychia lemnae]|uniref:Casein kinase I n=1 Tax=Stylonychia lemnae TaxID=5949 RepID=A0A078ANN1_STYLE|nr:casein kinase [Stylonychia lemnae]|eukprot:CDW83541.1 casein kinase [Stylonychia lemnae]
MSQAPGLHGAAGPTKMSPSEIISKLPPDSIVIGEKFLVGRTLGEGSFGQIQLGTNIETGDYEKQDIKNPQLAHEAKLLRSLHQNNHHLKGFPQVYWSGQEGNRDKGLQIMVIDLLGPSLEDLFKFCGGRFSLKTVLMIAHQMLGTIARLHAKNFVHRDIKPENFLMGLGKKSHIVHMIDFGLAKRYRDGKTHQHIPYKENKNLTGTARYASVNAHLGIEQSRRDDLESIGYVLVYLANGSLAWQNLNVQVMQEKYQKIMESKLALPIEQIAVGLPAEFSNYLHYCRSLRFEDKPDYPYLRQVFVDLMQKEGYDYDYVFDWTIVDKLEKPIATTIERNKNSYQPSMIVAEGASNDGNQYQNQNNAKVPPSQFKAKNKSESDEEEEEEDEQEESDSSEEEEAKDKESKDKTKMSFENENDETKVEFDAKKSGSSSGNSNEKLKAQANGKSSARNGR